MCFDGGWRATPDALKLIDGALQGTGRGSDLTKRLLSFVRREQLQSRSVDVLTLLHGMDDLLRRSVGPMIDIRIDAAADLWPATVDPSQLELALLNLAVNARDALPSGGTITIRLQNERVAGGAPYPAELRAGDYVRITVDDTGVGMDPATLARATEPFFTTKSGGRGTGLGLSSVHGLALQSHGALRLTSGCNVGTTVELWLPRVSEATGALPLSDHAKPSGNPAPGKLNVLLVEDDALIAMSTQAVLEDLGHDVRVALSGAKALDTASRRSKHRACHYRSCDADHDRPGAGRTHPCDVAAHADPAGDRVRRRDRRHPGPSPDHQALPSAGPRERDPRGDERISRAICDASGLVAARSGVRLTARNARSTAHRRRDCAKGSSKRRRRCTSASSGTLAPRRSPRAT